MAIQASSWSSRPVSSLTLFPLAGTISVVTAVSAVGRCRCRGAGCCHSPPTTRDAFGLTARKLSSSSRPPANAISARRSSCGWQHRFKAIPTPPSTLETAMGKSNCTIPRRWTTKMDVTTARKTFQNNASPHRPSGSLRQAEGPRTPIVSVRAMRRNNIAAGRLDVDVPISDCAGRGQGRQARVNRVAKPLSSGTSGRTADQSLAVARNELQLHHRPVVDLHAAGPTCTAVSSPASQTLLLFPEQARLDNQAATIGHGDGPAGAAYEELPEH